MELNRRFESEKKSVAMALVAILGRQRAAETAPACETALLDQAGYDHRDRTAEEIRSAWSASPSIPDLAGSLAGSALVSDLAGLAESTYAFRLQTLARILAAMETGPGDQEAFGKLVPELGLGPAEVRAYRADFV